MKLDLSVRRMADKAKSEIAGASGAASKPAAEKKEVLHPEESITTLLLVRHGHTRATEEGRLYSDPEAELTDEGLKQSKALAEWLMSRPPDVILSSTAKRVIATAESISGQTNLPILRAEGLNEWHVGDWEGRTYLDLKKN